MQAIDSLWVEEKFGSYSVAFALTVNNASSERLKHVETYLHYGQMENGFSCPREILENSNATIVARNTSTSVPAGSSGAIVWKIGDSMYYLCVIWSAPRNFYTHSNTLAYGITNGMPVQIHESGFSTLFNKLYNDKIGKKV